MHEFVHFLACIYAVTTVSYKAARRQMMQRFQERVNANKLDEKALKQLMKCLKSENPTEYVGNTNFNDSHFRIKDASSSSVTDNHLDYAELFLKLLFSRELFEEEFFTKEKQKEILSDNSTKAEKKAQIQQGAMELANEKSVLEVTAAHNLSRWIKDYFP